MYVLSNLSDADLDRLHTAVYDEKKKRIHDKVNSFPKPVASLGNVVDDIKLYRQMHDVTLLEAKTIIDWWNENS